MRPAADFPISLRIALPFLAAFALLGGPRLAALDGEMAAARLALHQAEPLAEARHLLTVVDWEPWRGGLWLQAGIEALRGGDSALAVQALENFAKFEPSNPQANLTLGEALWSQQKPDQALLVWDRLIETGQAPSSVFQRVVQWKRQAGWFSEAFQYAGSWVTAYPKNSQAAYTWDLLAAATQTQLSQTMIFRAAELDPGLTAKVKLFMDALGKSPNDAPPELRLLENGRVLGKLGEWDLALAAFLKAQEMNPGYAEAWAYSGLARQQLRQPGEPDILKAIELKPASAAIQALAGSMYRQAGDIEKAVQFYTKASELEPKNPLWMMEVGNLRADLHDNRGGLVEYQKAAALEPNNPQIWRQLAEYCLANDLEVRQVGLPAARQAAALAPESSRGLDTLGQIMVWLGDGDSAERFLQQALEKDPRDSTAVLHLGQLYLNQGRWSQAEYFLAQAAQSQGQATEANVIAARLLDRFFSGH